MASQQSLQKPEICRNGRSSHMFVSIAVRQKPAKRHDSKRIEISPEKLTMYGGVKCFEYKL
eukprot:scaffold374079_cov14-Prasinocladus_malaysianus.AAC.1